MDYLVIISFIIFAIVVICFQNGLEIIPIAVGIGIVEIVKTYKAFCDRLVKLEDQISENIPLQKRKQMICYLWAIETVVIMISFIVASSKSEWAYNIMCSTPVGGILSFFNMSEDFFIGFTVSAWLLSGIQFVLTEFVTHEVEKVFKSKVILFANTMCFTFFSGVVITFIVNNIFLRIRSGLSTWYHDAFFILKVLPMFLIICYYLIGFVFLVYTIRAFIDNIKILGVVFFIGLGFLVIVESGFSLLDGTVDNLPPSFLYIVKNFHEAHAFWYQLGLTIVITAIYDLGIIMLKNAKNNVKVMLKEGKEHDQIDFLKKVVRYANSNAISKIIMKKTFPEDVQKYENILSQSDVSTLVTTINDYEHRTEISHKKFVETQQSYNSDMLHDKLVEDYEKGYFPKILRRMMNQKISIFCKKFVRYCEALDRYKEELLETEFAYNRLSYPYNSKTYMETTLKMSFKLLPLLLIINIFSHLGDIDIFLRILYFMACYSLSYSIFALFCVIFVKNAKGNFFDSKASSIIAVLSLIFGVLGTMRMIVLKDSYPQIYYIAYSTFCSTAFIAVVLNIIPIRNYLRNKPYIMKKELRWIYSNADKPMQNEGSRKRRYTKKEVYAMICCELRKEEILNLMRNSD